MADEKKGITVKIDADLHAEIREYLERHEGMTMAEFMTSCATASARRLPTAMKTENCSKKNYGRERKSTSSS